MVQEASNSINAALPALCTGQPTQGDAYMIVARDLLRGIEALSTLPNVSPRGCALIAAHALECAIKAFLWHKGKKKEIRRRDVQHDLVALWNMTYKEGGLGIPEVPPDWVTILSSGHGPNFYFRYQEGEGKTVVQGGQTPALIPMAVELKKLIEMVELATKG
jgi:hypothetical protein